MRKVIASVLGAAAFVVIPLSLTAPPAFADPNFSEVCSQSADLGLSHGACVSFLQSNGNSGAIYPAVCKQFRQQYPDVFNIAFNNLGNCVSTLNGQRSPSPTPQPSPSPTPSPAP
jgi:hypothetical protein